MSNISSSFSSLTTMFQTSNIVCRSVNLTDELKIGLEYDMQRGLLNIFVKNTENNIDYPSQINILSNQYKTADDNYHYCSSEIKQDLQDEITDVSYREEEDEPKICIELSNIYVYDLYDENENENDLCQTMITSSSPSSSLLFSSSLSSSSSSCSDDQTIDNDDGYSTHSLDDIDQHHHQSISIPSSKFIIPFVPYQPHHYDYSSEEYLSSIHRLIGQIIWLSPFKKTVKQMMFNRLF